MSKYFVRGGDDVRCGRREFFLSILKLERDPVLIVLKDSHSCSLIGRRTHRRLLRLLNPDLVESVESYRRVKSM